MRGYMGSRDQFDAGDENYQPALADAHKRNLKAKEMFGKSWRQLDGFLRHAVILAMRNADKTGAK